MNRRAYLTDLADEQWLLVVSYVAASGDGRPPRHSKRELLNTLFYQAQAGLGPAPERPAPSRAPVEAGGGDHGWGHRHAVRADGR